MQRHAVQVISFMTKAEVQVDGAIRGVHPMAVSPGRPSPKSLTNFGMSLQLGVSCLEAHKVDMASWWQHSLRLAVCSSLLVSLAGTVHRSRQL